MSSYILLDGKQKCFQDMNHQPHNSYRTTTVSPGNTVYLFYIKLYAPYDSHERENDATEEIRGNQIGAITNPFQKIERFKVCRLSSVIRRPLSSSVPIEFPRKYMCCLSSVVRRPSSVPIEFPRKYISTLHQQFYSMYAAFISTFYCAYIRIL